MFDLICVLFLTFDVGGVGVMNQVQVQGKLISEGKKYYSTDLSDSPQLKNKKVWEDLSIPFLIPKEDCVKVD